MTNVEPLHDLTSTEILPLARASTGVLAPVVDQCTTSRHLLMTSSTGAINTLSRSHEQSVSEGDSKLGVKQCCTTSKSRLNSRRNGAYSKIAVKVNKTDRATV